MRFNRFGFTLIELIIVMALFGMISSLSVVVLLRPQATASLDATVTTLVADLRAQQLKAMMAEGEVAGEDHGVHFESSQYTVFRGSSYIPNPDLLTVKTGQNVVITPTPLDLIFLKRSGEIGSETQITVLNTQSNEQKVITINKLGGVRIN